MTRRIPREAGRRPRKAHRPCVRGEYFIKSRRQLRALTSPVRQEVVDIVATCGPLAVREMAPLLGRKPTALYYHVSNLCRVGLLLEVRRPDAAGRGESTYATPGRVMRIVPTAGNADLYAEIVASTLRVAERDLRRALAGGSDLGTKPRPLWGGRIKGWVTKRELEKINAYFEAIIELLKRRPVPGSRLHTVTWIHSD